MRTTIALVGRFRFELDQMIKYRQHFLVTTGLTGGNNIFAIDCNHGYTIQLLGRAQLHGFTGTHFNGERIEIAVKGIFIYAQFGKIVRNGILGEYFFLFDMHGFKQCLMVLITLAHDFKCIKSLGMRHPVWIQWCRYMLEVDV